MCGKLVLVMSSMSKRGERLWCAANPAEIYILLCGAALCNLYETNGIAHAIDL